MVKSRKPCVVSPSLLARVNSIDTTKKVLDEVKLGMSDWTDSDSKKENDNSATKEASECTCFFKREAAFYRDGVFRATGDYMYFKGVCPPKHRKEHQVGIQFPLSNSGLFHKTSVALWARL